MDYSNHSSIEIYWWSRYNCLASNTFEESHYISIFLSKILSNYIGDLKTTFHCQTFLQYHFIYLSLQKEIYETILVTRRQSFIIECFCNIRFQMNNINQSFVTLFWWSESNLPPLNTWRKSYDQMNLSDYSFVELFCRLAANPVAQIISPKSHCKAIILIRVLPDYYVYMGKICY